MDVGVAANKNAEEYGPFDYRKLSIDLKEIWRGYGMLKHVVYDVLKNSQLISNDIKAIQVSPDH